MKALGCCRVEEGMTLGSGREFRCTKADPWRPERLDITGKIIHSLVPDGTCGRQGCCIFKKCRNCGYSFTVTLWGLIYDDKSASLHS